MMEIKHTVENGVLRRTSVSQLKDAHGCLRRWWFLKVRGLPGKTFKSAELGVKCHAELEEYLKTGVDALGKITRPGLPLLPLPRTAAERAWADVDGGPGVLRERGLLIEHRFDHRPKGAPFEGSPLTIAGIPLDGYIDLVNLRGYPTVKVWDHKTTSSISSWGATEGDLLEGESGHWIQMAGYGEWTRLVLPGVQRLELGHIQYQTKSPYWAKPVSVRVGLDENRQRWLTVTPLAEAMKAAARETKQDHVPCNTNACEAYGGCPFRDAVCNAGDPFIAVETAVATEVPGESTMSDLDDLFTDDLAATHTESAEEPEETAEAPPPAAPAATMTYEQFLAIMQAQTAAQAPASPASTPAVQAEAQTKRAGRPAGSKNKPKPPPEPKPEPPPEAKPAPKPEPVVLPPVVRDAPQDPDSGSIVLFIDCAPTAGSIRLDDYINAKVDRLLKKFDLKDVRLAPGRREDGSEHPLAFGKWKGMLALLVRAELPLPGRYTVSSAGEFAQVVIETLIPLLDAENVVIGRR